MQLFKDYVTLQKNAAAQRVVVNWPGVAEVVAQSADDTISNIMNEMRGFVARLEKYEPGVLKELDEKYNIKLPDGEEDDESTKPSRQARRSRGRKG